MNKILLTVLALVVLVAIATSDVASAQNYNSNSPDNRGIKAGVFGKQVEVKVSGLRFPSADAADTTVKTGSVTDNASGLYTSAGNGPCGGCLGCGGGIGCADWTITPWFGSWGTYPRHGCARRNGYASGDYGVNGCAPCGYH